MSTINYLLIKRLDVTVPDSFVHSTMRNEFSQMVQFCPIIPQRLLSGDFAKPAPPDNLALIPVAYNLLSDALVDHSLRDALLANSHQVGYWFFNVFIIPDGLSVSASPVLHIVKNVTRGLDQFNI